MALIEEQNLEAQPRFIGGIVAGIGAIAGVASSAIANKEQKKQAQRQEGRITSLLNTTQEIFERDEEIEKRRQEQIRGIDRTRQVASGFTDNSFTLLNQARDAQFIRETENRQLQQRLREQQIKAGRPTTPNSSAQALQLSSQLLSSGASIFGNFSR